MQSENHITKIDSYSMLKRLAREANHVFLVEDDGDFADVDFSVVDDMVDRAAKTRHPIMAIHKALENDVIIRTSDVLGMRVTRNGKLIETWNDRRKHEFYE